MAPSLRAQEETAAAQAQPVKKRPNQLDIIKIDLFQLGINEARLWYEHELRKSSSLEVGAGFIYRNAFWYDRGERPMLGTGGSVYLGYRIYMDKKRYFFEPKFRSYLNPVLFYRYSVYNNEWLSYRTSNPQIYDCELVSGKIHQAGLSVKFGWQTYQGRVVMDFYSGLGFKFNPIIERTHVVTPLTAVCGVNSTTITVGRSETTYGTTVIFNLGMKLGLRKNNKDRNYQLPPVDPDADPGSDPEAPPKF